MSGGQKDYRDRFRRTPGEPDPLEGFVDRRDSLGRIYVSLVPFLLAEYYSELHYEFLPPALVFPIGFLLFWAFYYTYYKPGFLEGHLSSPGQWNMAAIPFVILGVCVWFLRITVVELLHLLVLRWVIPRPAIAAKRSPTGAEARTESSGPRPRPTNEETSASSAPKSRTGREPIPSDLARSLETLGLSGSPSWPEIHHRYRDLAKLFHPDLNPDVTDFGRRFIAIDQAYRRLGQAKDRYFSAH